MEGTGAGWIMVRADYHRGGWSIIYRSEWSTIYRDATPYRGVEYHRDVGWSTIGGGG